MTLACLKPVQYLRVARMEILDRLLRMNTSQRMQSGAFDQWLNPVALTPAAPGETLAGSSTENPLHAQRNRQT
jgi:hypothetical protein